MRLWLRASASAARAAPETSLRSLAGTGTGFGLRHGQPAGTACSHHFLEFATFFDRQEREDAPDGLGIGLRVLRQPKVCSHYCAQAIAARGAVCAEVVHCRLHLSEGLAIVCHAPEEQRLGHVESLVFDALLGASNVGVPPYIVGDRRWAALQSLCGAAVDAAGKIQRCNDLTRSETVERVTPNVGIAEVIEPINAGVGWTINRGADRLEGRTSISRGASLCGFRVKVIGCVVRVVGSVVLHEVDQIRLGRTPEHKRGRVSRG